jgi:nicotinamidase-related amidase
MSRDDTGLLVIDLQEKLMGKIFQGPSVIQNTHLLVQGAAILGVPVYATEQYPKGLGPTVTELSSHLPIKQEKLSFSCGVLPEVVDFFKSKGVLKVLLAGVEAHVCVQQTALDLIAQGFQVYLAADAVGSRHEADKELGLRRMERAGVVLTTSEAALFEWIERAGTPEFKAVSKLIVENDAKKA